MRNRVKVLGQISVHHIGVAFGDRTVQTAAKLVLEPIFEADLEPDAYGYRPKRSAHDAIQKVHKLICGIDTLILRGLEHGSFSVAREWTDWADPDPYSALGLPPRRWRVDLLLDLVNLLEQLSSPSSRELPKGD